MSDRNEIATLAGGCFWCLDAAFRDIEGVRAVVSGYTGGYPPDPTYEQVCRGTTGHAEAVQVTFDPEVISFADILDIFWTIHNPTQLNRQGNDVGTQYRSAIFYHSPMQHQVAEASRDAIQALWDDPVVTAIVAHQAFYAAEEYHQNYYARNPEKGYCVAVINPKLQKLRRELAGRVKARV